MPVYFWLLKKVSTLKWDLQINACHNGLGEMAAFLRLFAKMVTACTSPLAGTC